MFKILFVMHKKIKCHILILQKEVFLNNPMLLGILNVTYSNIALLTKLFSKLYYDKFYTRFCIIISFRTYTNHY